ncbi:MAG: hypothetical protein AB7G47_19270 [Mycolicibacterium sp.]|uniref:hypothetical protein n=1 Tax=Mycolicibacterium sp. TaxID=2320850 RepID=UPI003D10C831
MTRPDAVTTIKVSKELRNRISAEAARRHKTAQAFLQELLDEHDRLRRLDAVAIAIASADQPTLDAWRKETALWEAVEGDATGE